MLSESKVMSILERKIKTMKLFEHKTNSGAVITHEALMDQVRILADILEISDEKLNEMINAKN